MEDNPVTSLKYAAEHRRRFDGLVTDADTTLLSAALRTRRKVTITVATSLMIASLTLIAIVISSTTEFFDPIMILGAMTILGVGAGALWASPERKASKATTQKLRTEAIEEARASAAHYRELSTEQLAEGIDEVEQAEMERASLMTVRLTSRITIAAWSAVTTLTLIRALLSLGVPSFIILPIVGAIAVVAVVAMEIERQEKVRIAAADDRVNAARSLLGMKQRFLSR